MKTPVLTTLLTLLSVTNASNLNARHHIIAKRQLIAVSSSSATTTTGTTTGTTSTAGTPAVSSTVSSATISTPLPAPTGPPPLDTGTGVPPLASITFGMATQATLPVSSTYAAGASPPIAGAPALPTFAFNAADWPAQDITPPTDTDEVAEWMKELDGFNIPDLAPTVDGSCVNDSASASDAANRGWWTCGGYTRPTDIVACPDPMTWGVSFDDGPAPYSKTLLNYLNQKSLLATFFVVGSRVVERPQVLVEEYMAGHEISVHTWSHRHLTALSTESIVAELGYTRKAIQAVLGVTPTTMRPPYGDCDDRVRAISMAMGMTPIIWTSGTQGPFDTFDWKVAGNLVTGNDSFAAFQNILTSASTMKTGFIVLQHDLFEITVDLATGYTLDAALTHQPPFTLQPIGKCSKMPPTDLYRETTTNKTFPYTNSTASISGSSNSSTAGRTKTTGTSDSLSTGGASIMASGILAAGLAALGGFLL